MVSPATGSAPSFPPVKLWRTVSAVPHKSIDNGLARAHCGKLRLDMKHVLCAFLLFAARYFESFREAIFVDLL
jgi:hypothetical protein